MQSDFMVGWGGGVLVRNFKYGNRAAQLVNRCAQLLRTPNCSARRPSRTTRPQPASHHLWLQSWTTVLHPPLALLWKIVRQNKSKKTIQFCERYHAERVRLALAAPVQPVLQLIILAHESQSVKNPEMNALQIFPATSFIHHVDEE